MIPWWVLVLALLITVPLCSAVAVIMYALTAAGGRQ